MRNRNLESHRSDDAGSYEDPSYDVSAPLSSDRLDDLYARFDAYEDDEPNSARMRRRRSETDPGPRARGRMTEEARARLATERTAAVIADGPPTGYRWTTWDDPGAPRGPEPYPGWLVTDLAAADTELGIIKTGKEADVYLIERGVPDSDHYCRLASKRYRSGDHRLFHRDAGYLEGRQMRRSREQRAISNRTNFGRNLIAQQWAVTEFAALGQLWEAGAPVPYPVQHLGTELLMEYIGDDDGTAAPRLAQLRPEPTEVADLFQQLLEAMVTLGRLGYTHGDLSAYNLLVYDDELILIDLPQLVDIVANPQGRRFLERDAQRVCEWFASHGLPADVADPAHVVDLVLSEAGIG